MTAAAMFAAVFAALYAAHEVGVHWAQTSSQALGKRHPGWPGRRSCAAHVATKVVALVLLAVVTGLPLRPWLVGAALADADHFSETDKAPAHRR